MDDLKYDVLVVGAGPAGSTAARYAAMGGAKVLMIEKRQEIGSPVRCGEGIAKPWLDRIGIEPDPEWIANEIDGARIISPSGYTLEVDESRAGDESGYVIYRDLFDKALARMAAKEGVDIMLKTSALGVLKDGEQVVGVKAKYMGEEFKIYADVIIGADGFESQVGRWAGINTVVKPKDIDSAFQYTLVGVDVDPRFNEFYIGSIAPGGYIWVFPKGEDVANVGIGVLLSKIKERGTTRRLLDEFIASRPGLAKGRSIQNVSGAVSVSLPLDRTVLPGLMLVGDAARMIDPITGGGVYNGCIAGMIAGEVAGKAVKAGDFSEDFLMEYDRRWRDEMEERLYRNWMVKEKFSTLSDDDLDRIIKAISEVDMEKMSMIEILKAVESKIPDLVQDFMGMF